MNTEVLDAPVKSTTEVMRTPALPPANSMTPAVLLQMAVQQNADLDKLERLMVLQERWEGNEARKAYDTAFAAFKAESVRILKNKSVTDGPLRNKKYAELFAVVNAITPALSMHGLSSSWKLTKDERDWIEVTCTLKHIAGHNETVSMGGPPDAGGAKNAIQARASTVSYLERYTLKAITGLSEQEDDDDGRGYVDTGRAPPPAQAAPAQAAQPDFYPQAKFDTNLPAWQELIRAGTKTADRLITFLGTKQPLTEKQKTALRNTK